MFLLGGFKVWSSLKIHINKKVHTTLIVLLQTMCQRRQGMLELFRQCAAKYDDEGILRIPYNVHDKGNADKNMKELSMCYDKRIPELRDYCGPDCFFSWWPSIGVDSFRKTVEDIALAGSDVGSVEKGSVEKGSVEKGSVDVEEESLKIGWYGNIHSPLPDAVEHHTRPLLKEIGDQHPALFDVVHVPPTPKGVIDASIDGYLSLQGLTKYKGLIDIGGNGWSGRLKFLLYTQRPLLMVDRHYVEYFYTQLIPYVHYIPVKMDLSDLVEKAEWLMANEDKGRIIAQNAYAFALEHFTADKLADRVYEVYKNLACVTRKMRIVVSRYKEDIKWTRNFPNVLIYNKGPDDIDEYAPIKLPNVGREGHTFYRYICDNYHCLPDAVVNLQGDPFDHSPHVIENLFHLQRCLNADRMNPFVYLSERFYNDDDLYKCVTQPSLAAHMRPVYNQIFEDRPENVRIRFGNGAQFLVLRETILRRPLSFYQNIVRLLEHSSDPIEGYVVERLHPTIFQIPFEKL